MVDAENAPNEIDALRKLVTLSAFAMNRSVRLEEIQRQRLKANALVPERSGSAADDRFSAHDGALRKFLGGGIKIDALTEELKKTQAFLVLLARQ
jgi:hypothetical protein